MIDDDNWISHIISSCSHHLSTDFCGFVTKSFQHPQICYLPSKINVVWLIDNFEKYVKQIMDTNATLFSVLSSFHQQPPSCHHHHQQQEYQSVIWHNLSSQTHITHSDINVAYLSVIRNHSTRSGVCDKCKCSSRLRRRYHIETKSLTDLSYLSAPSVIIAKSQQSVSLFRYCSKVCVCVYMSMEAHRS